MDLVLVIATALRSVAAASGHSACTRTVACFSCSLCVLSSCDMLVKFRRVRVWLPHGWLRPFASPERHGRRDHETVSVCVLWPSEIFRNLSGSAASIGIGSAALDGRTSVRPTRALISSKRRMRWLGTRPGPDESTQVSRAVTRRDRAGLGDELRQF
jgi:hypothetical protein